MKYVVFDIGCIECGEPSDLIGIFDNYKLAKSVLKVCEKIQNANWTGQHHFKIYEISEKDFNKVISELYLNKVDFIEGKGKD